MPKKFVSLRGNYLNGFKSLLVWEVTFWVLIDDFMRVSENNGRKHAKVV